MADPLTSSALAGSYDRRAVQRLTLKGEQLAAVITREPVIALSAGAGSGKTTVLVERFLHLVTDDGLSPLEILAITYTEKAAAEMKERIVRRFEERGDDANRRHAEAAYISTIHGFCARLLRENPLAAGVDPAFGMIDDMRLGFFLDEERERMLSDPWFLEVRGLFPRGYRSHQDPLFELVKACVFDSREFGRGVPLEQSFDIDAHVDAAMRRLDGYCANLWRDATGALLGIAGDLRNLVVNGPARSGMHRRMCEMVSALDRSSAADVQWADEFCGLTAFTAGVKDVSERERIKAVLGPARKCLKELSGVNRAAEENLERDHIAPLKTGIYRHARELRERYERMKREHSLLDFEDLQRKALQLLEHTEVGAEYSSRFRHILLDEAQDTNPVQKSLVDALNRGGGQCLFAVGDIKQSVYGFRGAEVTIFRDMHNAAGAGRLQLQDNYRSRKEILDFINETGSRLWRDDASIEYVPLIQKLAYDTDQRNAPRVELMLVEKLKADPENGRDSSEDTDAVHQREALGIAMRIREIVEGADGRAPLIVYDRHRRIYRGAQYGDIAILARRRTHFASYERVLAELGIPAVADGGRGFFSGREVQDLLAALRVIANPFDEVALLAALRSPLFGWSDQDLVRLRATDHRDLWSACASGFVPRGDAADPAAYRTLSSLRRLMQVLPPVRLLHLLLERTAYVAALLRTARGRASAANVQKLLDFARSSAEVDGPDLHRFIRRAELAEDYLAQEREASIAAEGEDVVLLATIHGSKGLEWPVVILADLGANFGRSASGSLYAAADEVLVLAPKDADGKTLTPASCRLVTEAQKKRDEEEGRRLLYVGMTRAREYLILSGESALAATVPPVPHKLGAPIEWLCAVAGVTDANSVDHDTLIGSAPVRVSFATEASVAQIRGLTSTPERQLAAARRSVERSEPVAWQAPASAERARIEATVRELLDAAAPPRHSTAIATATVTQMVYYTRCPMVYYFNLVLQIEEHPRKRRKSEIASSVDVANAAGYSAVEIGAVVHDMLERADLAAPPRDEARRLVNEQDSSAMIDADRARVERMLAAVLADPLIERARHATRLEREYPFYLNVNGTLVRGVIDLVFSDADGRGVVVDYKSNDLAAPDRVNVLSQYYRPQIEMYALAAGRAGLVQPTEATLYFLNKPVARTFDVGSARLDAVEADMSEALARISRGAWDTEPGEKCRSCGYRKRGFCEVGKRFVE
jgi:ATP-dependent helicase/nuclease subunit A